MGTPFVHNTHAFARLLLPWGASAQWAISHCAVWHGTTGLGTSLPPPLAALTARPPDGGCACTPGAGESLADVHNRTHTAAPQHRIFAPKARSCWPRHCRINPGLRRDGQPFDMGFVCHRARTLAFPPCQAGMLTSPPTRCPCTHHPAPAALPGHGRLAPALPFFLRPPVTVLLPWSNSPLALCHPVRPALAVRTTPQQRAALNAPVPPFSEMGGGERGRRRRYASRAAARRHPRGLPPLPDPSARSPSDAAGCSLLAL